jgi:hypothetical protein
MTAKEKSLELVDRFINVEYLIDFQGMTLELAKQCALIAVDEILKSVGVVEWDGAKDDDEEDGDYDGVDFTNFFQYWNEVKQEIENL